MKLEGTQAKSFTDVIAYSVDPVFDKREIVIDTLAADLVPGDVIKADGTKFGAADTEAPLVVIHPAKAGAQVHVIIADRGVVLKRDAWRAQTQQAPLKPSQLSKPLASTA